MTRYFLMHKNRQLAVFTVDGDSITGIRANEKNAAYFPVSYGDRLVQFIQNRGIPVSRDWIERDLPGVSTFQYALMNLGLSLTDCYWFKPVDSEYTWESVNLFRNDFRDSISLDLTVDGSSIVGRTNFIPSSSLKGDLKKKWLIDTNGSRLLVKGNYSDGCIQSISEVFATKIYEMQGSIPFTRYEFMKISSNGKEILGCKCDNFCTEQLEFVSAYDIVNSGKKPNSMNYYQYFLDRIGLEYAGFFDAEIEVDFLITNTDRHFNNFGILRDSDSLRAVGVAPVFDSGNSLFYRNSYVPLNGELLEIEVSSFSNYEVNLLKSVTDRGVIDIRKLPDGNALYGLLKRDVTLTDEKAHRIVEAYRRKIKCLTDFQNGASIWSYAYKKSMGRSFGG